MIFEYKAYDTKKEIVKGRIEALSKEEAKIYLHANNLRIINIKPINFQLQKFKLEHKFSESELSFLFSEISMMIDGGIDIGKIIELYILENKGWKKEVYTILNKEIHSGKFLSEAMSKTKAFPVLSMGMIKVAETSGNLSDTLKKLSEFYKNQAKLKKKLINALAYPIILSITCFIVIQIIFNFVFPIFVDVFASNNTELPWATKFMIFLSEHFASFGSFYYLGLLIFLLAILIGKNSNKGKKKIDAILIKTPIVGKLIKENFELYFINSMLIQMNTGVDILKIIYNAKSLTSNSYFKEKLENIEESLKRGSSITSTFQENELLSSKTQYMLALGEESSSLLEILKINSDLLQETHEDKIERLNIYLEPLLIFIMALIVGFIVFSIAIPMFDLVNQI